MTTESRQKNQSTGGSPSLGQALCREEDPELFFPVGNTGPALLQIAQAKAVCRRCPVMNRCLEWALDSGQDSGVWGGLSEDERRALKRRQARQTLKNRAARTA
jgi:WhiB family redox-sensing transcriptional regulator